MHSSADRSEFLGILLILLGVVFLSVMDGVMKHLIAQDYAVVQILAMRSWIVLPILLVWVWRKGGFASLKTNRWRLHLLRVVVGFGAPFFFFKSLSLLPLADATVIFFAAPFIMTALSVPLLKEHVGPHRWTAIVVGLIGIIVAANPTGDVFNEGIGYAFLASVCYSLFMLVTRKMGKVEGTFKLVFYFHAWIGLVTTTVLVLGIGGLSFKAIAIDPAPGALGGVLIVSVLVILGHLSLTQAFTLGPVGLLVPFEYSALIWSALIGYIGFGHIPAENFWFGAVLVVGSGIYLVHRESRLRKGPAADVAVVTADPLAVPLSEETPSDPQDQNTRA